MLEHAQSHLHLSTEAIIGVVFGVLTLTATVASIQFKDSMVRFCCTPRRSRGTVPQVSSYQQGLKPSRFKRRRGNCWYYYLSIMAYKNCSASRPARAAYSTVEFSASVIAI
ncbi:uncharacterized protein BDZ99DRAFT_463556 [Mytilinidion resinicola]|uniref:Uncharacterized protein n=1 Tax=Mytilinidion resinicola TaxID=574789 RepID=A0A6A6YMN8_9PEZI|nr:uncharacterized protein BDZ99DRAFT_463556 [Mytilinidion resinicola]KAF2809808.1 hypothetical protein BDZ99DRAFT_463556 [Mytilinidion resinicola]